MRVHVVGAGKMGLPMACVRRAAGDDGGDQLHATGGRYALCTTCIGVGQGIAVILERV